MSKGTRFSDEFKQAAVVQVFERGYSLEDIKNKRRRKAECVWLHRGVP